MQEWRYELKVRYVPENLNDLHEKDKVTFYYYYDQVRYFYLIKIIINYTHIYTHLAIQVHIFIK